MINQEAEEGRINDNLQGSLMISRMVYAKMSAIQGGVALVAIVLLIKVLFHIFGWGDVPIVLIVFGIYIHTRRTRILLENIWGIQLLTVGQVEASDLLRQAQTNLKQKEW